jgi:very-short-patch-repair endonuclease
MTKRRLTTLAQKLRREPTEAQKCLWSRLRGRQLGVQFVREFQIAGFICDFACRSARLIIELDGGQHAESEADVERTRIIELHGYTVIRFWNNEVLSNTDGVVLSIAQTLAAARNRRDWFEDEG